jgi:cation diffusion facilitator family transporter
MESTGALPPAAGKSVAESEKQAAAGSSVWAAIFLTIIKLVVGFMTGSLGMLAEAAHSGLDLVAAVVTLLAVNFSDRPADQDHTYGHGKIENFSALIEALLLVITCVWIVYESVQRLFFHTTPVDANIWAFIVMAISIVVNMSRSKMLYATARKHHSQALEADALHFSTDVWSSWVVVGGLALVWLGQNILPQFEDLLTKADSVAALGVAVIVAFVTYDLGKRTVDVLLDRAPSGIPEAIAEAAAQVDGVLEVGQVRVRRSGPRLFVDMTVGVDRNLPVERTHSVAEAVENRVQQVSPGADVVVHTDPRENERESVALRCRVLAARHQVAVHNIGVHDTNGEIFVDLHLEVDDHLTLRQAHDTAKHIEGDIKRDNPAIAHVNTHIESRGTGVDTGTDITAEEGDQVRQVQQMVDSVVGVPSCHSVHIRRQDSGKLLISLHCTLDETLPIVAAHGMCTRIEDRLMETLPNVERVLVHAEPRDAAGPA